MQGSELGYPLLAMPLSACTPRTPPVQCLLSWEPSARSSLSTPLVSSVWPPRFCLSSDHSAAISAPFNLVFAVSASLRPRFEASSPGVRGSAATAQCLWRSAALPSPALQVQAQARRGIAALLEARRPIHLLTHPVWSAILHDWQDPHSQHDVAEFALFAASALPIPCMQLKWQSRVTTDTGVEITEAGRTVTLGLDLTTMRHPDVQGLINHWSTQVITCAAVACSFTGCALPGSWQISGPCFMPVPYPPSCIQG